MRHKPPRTAGIWASTPRERWGRAIDSFARREQESRWVVCRRPALAPMSLVPLSLVSDQDCRTGNCSSVFSSALFRVFIVAAHPEAGFIAPTWGAVEPLVHAPEAVQPARICRVGMVDDVVLERKCAHPGRLPREGRPVCAGA